MEHQGFISLIPVILAIVAAVVTRKVILSLFLGVYVGVLLVVGGNPIEATTTMMTDYLLIQLTDSYNAGVLVLLVFIGGFVSIMEKSGGAAAFAKRVGHIISNRSRAQLSA